ncbi:hypothetical protein BGZ57DRAFT_950315 [Hyaloscypha finlandica]|nr:hypothetical protein BGZ57DRAFT_950315 [Hyaloscypha finlandica]
MAVHDKTIAFISAVNQGIAASVSQPPLYWLETVITTSKGLSADKVQLDLQSDDSIAAAKIYLTVTYCHIDALINNAGVLLDRASLTIRQLYDTTFSTNVADTAWLTESLCFDRRGLSTIIVTKI